ncbi:hypothetical protein DIE17_36065, partial [Burkholderia sp. Bp9099]
MPAGAAHVPHGSCPRRSSSTDTILYIHTVFQERRECGKPRRIAPSFPDGGSIVEARAERRARTERLPLARTPRTRTGAAPPRRRLSHGPAGAP